MSVIWTDDGVWVPDEDDECDDGWHFVEFLDDDECPTCGYWEGGGDE